MTELAPQAPCPGGRLWPAQEVKDIVFLGEPAFAVLGKYHLTVGHGIEHAGIALAQLCLDAELAQNARPQTGGPRVVVSARAVADRDLHSKLRLSVAQDQAKHRVSGRLRPGGGGWPRSPRCPDACVLLEDTARAHPIPLFRISKHGATEIGRAHV